MLNTVFRASLLSTFLCASMGAAQAQSCPGSCDEAKAKTTLAAPVKDSAPVQGPVQIADDEQEIKELEQRLNEILVVEEDGSIVLREEFKGTIPFPPERLERMLNAFIELDDKGKIKIKNPDMIRPYLPMMRRFLSQGGLDKLRELQKLPPAERQKAMQRLFGNQGNRGGQARPAPKPRAMAPTPKPAPKAAPKADEDDERPRMRRRQRQGQGDQQRNRWRGNAPRGERPNMVPEGMQEMHRQFSQRLTKIERSLARIERLLDEMMDAHGEMERGNRNRGRNRGWGQRDDDDDRGGRRGWGGWGRNRGNNGGDWRERMDDLRRMFGNRGRNDRNDRGDWQDRMDDMRRMFGKRGGRDFDPREMMRMLPELRRMMEEMGGPEGFRRMMEEFGGDEGMRRMFERFRGNRRDRGADRDDQREERRERRGSRRRSRDVVQSLDVMRRGLQKLSTLMEPADLKRMGEALRGMEFSPENLRNPQDLMGKMGEVMSPEDMGRMMEVLQEFMSTEEGQAMREEIEKLSRNMDGLMNSEKGQELMEGMQELMQGFGEKNFGKEFGKQFGKRMEGMLRNRGERRTERRGERRAERRTERNQDGLRYGQPHPQKKKARLY
ncbi:MAG TPA: hypothetical protein DEA08_29805 [Planctomycetes bacterium]|nr:hypothetical protein [Planctomycetota bacterium]